jgi:hypothetical protein
MNFLFGFLLVAAIVLVLCLLETKMVREKERGFRKRFPPISDGEFVARCAPGTNPTVALRVRRIMADTLDVEYERIYPSTGFIRDLGAD